MLFFGLITLIPRWVRMCWLVVCYFVVKFWLLQLCLSFNQSWIQCVILMLLYVACCVVISILADYYAYKWSELGLRYAEQAKGDVRDSHAVKAAKYFMKSSLLNL